MSTQRSLRLEDLGVRPIPGMTLPSQVTFGPTGDRLYYLAPEADGRLALFGFDVEDGSERLVLAAPTTEEQGQETLEEELRKQRLRQTLGGVSGFQIIDERRALVNIGGALQLVDVTNGSKLDGFDLSGLLEVVKWTDECLIATTGHEIVLVSSNGQRDSIVSVAGEGMSVGVAEYVAQEELDRMSGLWLDPSGKYLAYTEVDESRVQQHRIVRSDVHPNVVEAYRYPFVGATNASVVLCMIELATKTRTVIAHFDDHSYLGNVVWLDPQRLTFSMVNREQNRLTRSIFRVSDAVCVEWDAEDGAPWVNLPEREFAFEGDLLTTSEAEDGQGRLVRLRADGSRRTIGDVVVRRLLALAGSSLLLVATGEVPTQEWLYLVDLNSGDFQRLASDDTMATGVLAPGGGRVYVEASSRRQPPRSLLISTRPAANEAVQTIRASTPPFDLVTPELFDIKAATGETLYGALYLPPEEQRAGAPLIVSVYGGPHAQLVTDSYGLTLDLQAQYLASCGAVVVKLDNRGSYGRGRTFEAYLSGRFGEVELADQLEAVQYCQRRFGTDPNRVGIYGWSYGGYMTLIAMTRAPEVFRVGVAGAPCVDFRWYDTAYTERYLGDPIRNRDGYDRTSVLDQLEGLQGKLMIIHGLMDENVHFGHTASFISRANELGRDLELVVLPASRHAPVDAPSLTRVATSRTEFLLRHLDLESPDLESPVDN